MDYKYNSAMKGEKERLIRQSDGYYEFDMSAINQVTDTFDRTVCVLDLGCSDGRLTFSRFASEKIKKVIGIDYNERDIEEANEIAATYGDKFKFYRLDIESVDFISRLKKIFVENGIEKVDIVFSALVLHHLRAPEKLLKNLHEVFSRDGKIIIRGSDDGGKLCYPKTELLEDILRKYEKAITVSDRSNGRKLYTRLFDSEYRNIRILYAITDTCGKDLSQREHFFDVGFGFRLNTIDALIRSDPQNEQLKKEREWFERALSELRRAFCEPDFWYCNTSYIAIAEVE